MVATASAGRAQVPQELFSRVDTLTLSDGSPATGQVSLAGDRAIVFREGPGVHVFERPAGGDQWLHTETLVASDQTQRFGLSASIDGNTIAVGAEGAVFVFQRSLGGQGWQEVAKLSGEVNSFSFGTSVDVSGSTVLVGAPIADTVAGDLRGGPGVVYVFDKGKGRAHAWTEVARLVGPTPESGFLDYFGIAVSIDRDTAVIGAVVLVTSQTDAYVFSRDQGGRNGWGRVARLPVADTGSWFPSVSVSGNLAGVSLPYFTAPSVVRIFRRNQGGPDMWAEDVSLSPPTLPPGFVDMRLDGNVMLAGFLVFPRDPTGARILARHQGGKNAWGEVARIQTPVTGDGNIPSALAVSGDTALVGSVRLFIPGLPRSPIHVFVADTDRDGIRDGIDPCPRDPMNNVAGGCQRASATHPVLDHLISRGDVTSRTRGTSKIITATFTNTSDTAVHNPFFEVTELTRPNVLVNADEGRARVGATLSPDVGDGILSPGESMTVTFRIRLHSHKPFQFLVRFHGDPAW